MSNTNGGDVQVHLNGHTPKFIETIDPEDPNYRRELQRPPDVKEDMRQMESRQRVSSILNSQAFREELESIIADQLKHGPHPASLIALQQISDLLLPNASQSRWHHISSMGKGGNVVIPINDIRGIDSLNYSKGERLLRCKLASLFRLIDLYGWSNNSINNCVSLRLNPDLDHYLMNAYGLMYNEVSAASLVKVDINANIIESGNTTYYINKSLFVLHSAIYKARPDVKCVIHVHTPSTQAVSILKCGLLPLTQESVLCGNVSYHEFKGLNNYTDESIRKLLAEDVGPINKVIFIRNYGVITCGETIEEAWYLVLNCVYACETQLRVFNSCGGNLELVNLLSEEQKRTFTEAYLSSLSLNDHKKWKVGELEFEACMRCLDNAAYRTGYVYRQPIMRSIDRNAVKEVEIPPTCSSFSQDPEFLKKLKEEKQKYAKSDWMCTPNAYSKTEFEETGPYPKKVTKWLAETSPNKTSTPVRTEGKNQFAPQGADPKELKNHQKQIKQDRFDEKRTPGHQSKILDNLVSNNNDDAETNNDNNVETVDSAVSTKNHYKVKSRYYEDTVDAGPKSRVLLNIDDRNSEERVSGQIVSNNGDYHTSPTITTYGSASKGIIKRDQQHNTYVYKTVQSPPNPFQQMNKDELERYKKEIAQRQLKDQVQRKDDMHRELLDQDDLIITSKWLNNMRKQQQQPVENKSSANEPTDSKKKSNTIPRSKSLSDKKHDNDAESSSSREASPSTKNKLSQSVASTQLTPGVILSSASSTGAVDNTTHSSSTITHNAKSATLSTSLVQTGKPDKPKKKSKLRSLSFLKSSKKNKD